MVFDISSMRWVGKKTTIFLAERYLTKSLGQSLDRRGPGEEMPVWPAL